MNSFDTIFSKLHVLLVAKYKRELYSFEVATVLGIDQRNFCLIKKRKKIPYQGICTYCYMNNININSLLFNKSSNRYKSIKYFTNVKFSY